MILKCIYSLFCVEFGNILFLFSRKMGNCTSDGACTDSHTPNDNYPIARVVTDVNDAIKYVKAPRICKPLSKEEKKTFVRFVNSTEKEKKRGEKMDLIIARLTLPTLPIPPTKQPHYKGSDGGNSGNGGGGGTCVPGRRIAILIPKDKNRV